MFYDCYYMLVLTADIFDDLEGLLLATQTIKNVRSRPRGQNITSIYKSVNHKGGVLPCLTSGVGRP